MVKTMSIPSLCIPRVYHKFDEAYIEQVFCQLFGTHRGRSCVERIDLINRQDRNTGEPFHVAFIHFVESGVAETKELKAFVERIEAGNEVKIEYSHPWFWKVRKNQAKRRTPLAQGCFSPKKTLKKLANTSATTMHNGKPRSQLRPKQPPLHQLSQPLSQPMRVKRKLKCTQAETKNP